MKKEETELVGQVANIRHQLHISRNLDNYCELQDNLITIFDNLNNNFPTEFKHANIEIAFDCECEEGACVQCNEMENDELDRVKESNNSIIENWLKKYDTQFTTDHTPTGEARARWVNSI